MSPDGDSRAGTVLHLIDTDGPGGAETIFVDLAVGLAERGWTSVPVVTKEGWSTGELERRGMDATVVRSSGGWDVPHLGRLWSLIGREDVDLLQAHLLGPALYGAVAGRLRGIPTVATFHGGWDLRESGSLPRLKRSILASCLDVAVSVSTPLSRELGREASLRTVTTRVIPNGIDVSNFGKRERDGFRSELGLGPDDFLVGTVGNLRPAKSHRSFLELAGRLGRRDDGYRFVVVGDTDVAAYQELRALRTKLGLDDRLFFTGYRDDVDRVMAGLDCFVLTSRSEGFSLTTVEAMASGLPVVATRCGGPEEIIDHGRTGVLVDVDDLEEMVRVVDKLRRSPSIGRRLGRAARRHVSREYSRSRMIDSYASLYRSLLAEPVEDRG